MKLYQIRKLLSRDAAETAAGYILPAVLVVDIKAGLCFFAMVGGAHLTGFETVMAVFFAMQIAVCFAALVWSAVCFIKEYRAPKRYGVITPEAIRRALEVRR